MFRTELTIAPATGQLPRTARVLTMGSCFADSIGTRLEAHKVETRVNPFGTVFQPLALARLLRAAAGEDVDWQQHLVQARGRWQSYDLHGSVGADSPVELLQYIQEVVRQTGEFLHNANLVVLTLGTAWAYRLRETGELVSNCHKQPADLFVRELLTPDEIINALAETHAYVRRLNPDVRFVLTVSPVRHLKDTLPLNAVSKSVLRVATHIVSDLLPGVAYFPAFELLTDDLRDYRFYAADMLHPSEVAEDYIWDKFARTYFDADFGRFRKEWTAVRQSLGHRPLHEGAPEHRQFLESTREKLEQLSLRKVDVEEELRTVRARLDALPLPKLPEPTPEPEDNEERIDIGEGTTPTVQHQPAAAEPANATARPPRLSPEEFRAQRAARPERGRRDGRGKGQPAQPSETEQFQAASFGEADEFAQQPFLTDSAADLTPVVSAVESTSEAADAAQEPGRKKKRRSRGGAKRTARKHALRLAAEMGLQEGQLAASDAALEAAAAQADTEASVTQTVENPVTGTEASEPRRDRRNDGGRGVTRVPLFAAPAASAANAAAESLASGEAAVPAVSSEETGESLPPATSSSSRRNRNRKKKKGNRPVVVEIAVENGPEASPALAPRGAVEAVVDAETLNAARNDERRDKRRPQEQPVATLPVSPAAGAVAATPVIFVSSETAASAEPSQTVSPKASKPSKRKSRLQVGGRTEKPAVDTPIIPVDAVPAVRTQVAAGRLTGSSASLVQPSAPVETTETPVAKPVTVKTRSKKAAATKPSSAEAVATTVGAATEPSGSIETTKKGSRASKVKAAPQQAKPVKAAEEKPATTTDASVPTASPAPKATKPKVTRTPAASSAGSADAPQAEAREPSAAMPAQKPAKAAAKPATAKPAAAKKAVVSASVGSTTAETAFQPAKKPVSSAKAKATKASPKAKESTADVAPTKSTSTRKAAEKAATKPAAKRKAAPKADASQTDAPEAKPAKPAAKARAPKKPAA